MSVDDRLAELGITLPPVPAPAGNYVHAVRTGQLLFLSGKGPGGSTGKVGADVGVEQAYDDARQIGLVLIAVMREELGSLDRVGVERFREECESRSSRSPSSCRPCCRGTCCRC